jgi:SAM-dependent methyltransferase
MQSKFIGYSAVRLSGEDIKAGAYKQYLGGGSAHWESRGKFQLDWLKSMGLQPSNTLLDVGCGPLRAGMHLLKFLDEGNYCGIDYNRSFIDAARNIVETECLSEKRPKLCVLEDFSFGELGVSYDFVLAFSVLNHCTPRQRRHFVESLPFVIHGKSKVFITHASWFQNKNIDGTPLVLRNRFESLDLDIMKYGWQPGESIYPIIELGTSILPA